MKEIFKRAETKEEIEKLLSLIDYDKHTIKEYAEEFKEEEINEGIRNFSSYVSGGFNSEISKKSEEFNNDESLEVYVDYLFDFNTDEILWMEMTIYFE